MSAKHQKPAPSFSECAVMPIRETADRGDPPRLWDDEIGWITEAPDGDCWLCQEGICQQRARVPFGSPARVVHTMAGRA